jgi:hypothetical protein
MYNNFLSLHCGQLVNSMFCFIEEHKTPIVGILLYLLYPKNLRINKTLLHTLSIFHNLFLTLFSAWTFYSILQILQTDGIIFKSGYYFKNPKFAEIMYYFYLSKYYEFFDTFLLYLNGKTPIFLQKFHHIGAVIGWYLFLINEVDVIWLPSFVNSFVHTIMYFYYLCCLLKINQVRFIKKYITTLQLLQFTVSSYFAMVYYYPPIETQEKYNILLIFETYVFILILLFLQFFYKTYVKTNVKINVKTE